MASKSASDLASDVTIRCDLRPGDIGRIAALHGTAYRDEQGAFGLVFEAYVCKTLAEFVLENDARGKLWFAERGDELVACAALVERRDGERLRGQLRWVLADPSARGLGLGRKLVEATIDHARAIGADEVFLETTAGLDASMRIYRDLGFVETGRAVKQLWRPDTTVIWMSLEL
ncbi:MAG: GNAT family N-acetyltransferase [Pseudomonadota bacterium]